jgi:cytidylate kinase
MNRAKRDEQLAAALEHVVRQWETSRTTTQTAGPPSHPFTIALARQAGTQAATVARELGSRLGWQAYDQELLELIAQDMGLRTNLLQSVDEKRVSLMQEDFQSFMGVPHVSNSAFAQHLIKTVLALGAHGNCVIVGRGAAFILPSATTLRVLLVAPLEHRIETLGKKRGVGREEAEHEVNKLDRERKRFVEEVFAKNRDLKDSVLYDLVLNVSNFSAAACAQVIIEALRQRQAAALEKRTAPAG